VTRAIHNVRHLYTLTVVFQLKTFLLEKTRIKIENPGKKKETIRRIAKKGLFQIATTETSASITFLIRNLSIDAAPKMDVVLQWNVF